MYIGGLLGGEANFVKNTVKSVLWYDEYTYVVISCKFAHTNRSAIDISHTSVKLQQPLFQQSFLLPLYEECFYMVLNRFFHVFRPYLGLVSIQQLSFEFMTFSQRRQLSKLIGSHEPTHVLHETRVSILKTEQRSPSAHLISSSDEFWVDQTCGHGTTRHQNEQTFRSTISC